jgi:hypothetical protein
MSEEVYESWLLGIQKILKVLLGLGWGGCDDLFLSSTDLQRGQVGATQHGVAALWELLYSCQWLKVKVSGTGW